MYHPTKIFFFGYSINMSNLQQNNIQNEIEQIKKQIDLLQDRQRKTKKVRNANQKNTSKKKTKAGFFSNQKKYKT